MKFQGSCKILKDLKFLDDYQQDLDKFFLKNLTSTGFSKKKIQYLDDNLKYSLNRLRSLQRFCFVTVPSRHHPVPRRSKVSLSAEQITL